MSSIANDGELSSERQLPGNSSNTADQDALGPSAETNGRAEVVDGLDLVPPPDGSIFLKFNGENEYVQLCNRAYNTHTKIDCGLPFLLKEHGDPLARCISRCGCDDKEDHICWLHHEFCGTRGKNEARCIELVNALDGAVYALENELLAMYHDSAIPGSDTQSHAWKAGRLTPGLHKVATMRFGSLIHGVKRLQEFHKKRLDTSSDASKSASSAGNGGTDDKGSDDGNSDGSEAALADLERRLLALKADLLKPLKRVPNTKASIIEASQDLKLAVRTYDRMPTGPRSIVRAYYEQCVLMVADAHSSLEHYSDHAICDGLLCDLNDIDGSYRAACDNLYNFYSRAELDDGLEEILWSIWDETRSCFEESSHVAQRGEGGMGRPHDLDRDQSELDSQEDPDEDPEDF